MEYNWFEFSFPSRRLVALPRLKNQVKSNYLPIAERERERKKRKKKKKEREREREIHVALKNISIK